MRQSVKSEQVKISEEGHKNTIRGKQKLFVLIMVYFLFKLYTLYSFIVRDY